MDALDNRFHDLVALLCDHLDLMPRNPAERGRSAAKRFDLRTILETRKAFRNTFPDLFSDPPLYMLLDLYQARRASRKTSVSDLCITSEAPATTALRWIATLEQRKLIVRTPDPKDLRRIWLDLSEEAAIKLDALFGARRLDVI